MSEGEHPHIFMLCLQSACSNRSLTLLSQRIPNAGMLPVAWELLKVYRSPVASLDCIQGEAGVSHRLSFSMQAVSASQLIMEE